MNQYRSLKMSALCDAYRAGVNSQAVILVVDNWVGDVDTSAAADVESIGVVTSLAVSIGVVDVDAIQSKAIGAVDAEDLNGGVLDRDALDLGVDQFVGIEELGLLLAAVTPLAIPPAGSITIENGTGGSPDSDISPGDGDQGARPFLVAEGGGSLEDDLGNSSV